MKAFLQKFLFIWKHLNIVEALSFSLTFHVLLCHLIQSHSNLSYLLLPKVCFHFPISVVSFRVSLDPAKTLRAFSSILWFLFPIPIFAISFLPLPFIFLNICFLFHQPLFGTFSPFCCLLIAFATIKLFSILL
jgi:hypothetical protein